MKTAIAGCLIALFCASSAIAADLKADAPYQATKSNPVTYDVDFSAVVTAPYKTKLLKVWLPIPQSDFGQEVSDSKLSTFPVAVDPKIAAEPVFGNRFAYFEFNQPQGAQIIRHNFRVKVYELRWDLDPDKITAPARWPEEFATYRRGESQSVVVDTRFASLVDEIVPARKNPLADMAAVMNWANSNFTYDHVDASMRASAVHALEKRRGHCSDYHGFCASMGRALGYLTRVTYGINTFPKNSPSHCKLEVFLPPYGWVSFDVSETQKLISDINKDAKLSADQKKQLAQAANERLLSGFRDNTWYIQTRGTDYDLVPPATKKVPVVRTIYAEADGVPLADPDPANPNQRQFAWMTAHSYKADKAVTYPFKDYESLRAD
jgi:transglutaminase-like putative cysteine protease